LKISWWNNLGIYDVIDIGKVTDKTGRVITKNEVKAIKRKIADQAVIDKNDGKTKIGFSSFLFLQSKALDAYDILVKEGDKSRTELFALLHIGVGQMNTVVSMLHDRGVEHKRLKKFHIIKTLDEALKWALNQDRQAKKR